MAVNSTTVYDVVLASSLSILPCGEHHTCQVCRNVQCCGRAGCFLRCLPHGFHLNRRSQPRAYCLCNHTWLATVLPEAIILHIGNVSFFLSGPFGIRGAGEKFEGDTGKCCDPLTDKQKAYTGVRILMPLQLFLALPL